MDSENYLRNVFKNYGEIVSIEQKEDDDRIEVYQILFDNDKNAVNACLMDTSDDPRIMYMYTKFREGGGLFLYVEMKKKNKRFFGEINEGINEGIYEFFLMYGPIERIDALNNNNNRVFFECPKDAKRAYEQLKGVKCSYLFENKRYSVRILDYNLHHPLVIYFRYEEIPVQSLDQSEPSLVVTFVKKLIY